MRERQMIDRQNYFHKTLKQALQDKEVETALECYEELDGAGKRLNVTESSNLIELLIKSDMVGPATAITEQMLHRDAYPMPKIFRFLLNRLASMGEVEMVNNIGECLSPKVKKEVSFDNR